MHILGGSLDQEGDMLSAGVHEGPSEFEIKNIRYVQGKVSDMKKGETVKVFMERIYMNSTGCLINKDFKPFAQG